MLSRALPPYSALCTFRFGSRWSSGSCFARIESRRRSYYPDLLDAGVRIFEYVGGLLHTKSLALDGEATLIGSANMDRRSFELNYENNILLIDPALTAEMRARQDGYVA